MKPGPLDSEDPAPKSSLIGARYGKFEAAGQRRVMANSKSERSLGVSLKADRALVVFHFGGKLGALPLESVEKIAPMADLARPPGLAAPLEGILNLAGVAVPVLRLDRLLQLPELRPGLYSMLVVLKGESENRVAMLVDRVSEILHVPNDEVLPVGEGDSFNACVEATVTMRGHVVHVLSAARILLGREQESLSAFRTIERLRLDDWKPGVV